MFLNQREKHEVEQLVGAKIHGATPLVMACRNGHYDVAEYLIEKCGADVEQPGSGKTRDLSVSNIFFELLRSGQCHSRLTTLKAINKVKRFLQYIFGIVKTINDRIFFIYYVE